MAHERGISLKQQFSTYGLLPHNYCISAFYIPIIPHPRSKLCCGPDWYLPKLRPVSWAISTQRLHPSMAGVARFWYLQEHSNLSSPTLSTDFQGLQAWYTTLLSAVSSQGLLSGPWVKAFMILQPLLFSNARTMSMIPDLAASSRCGCPPQLDLSSRGVWIKGSLHDSLDKGAHCVTCWIKGFTVWLVG